MTTSSSSTFQEKLPHGFWLSGGVRVCVCVWVVDVLLHGNRISATIVVVVHHRFAFTHTWQVM
jgi:hypothetical protein